MSVKVASIPQARPSKWQMISTVHGTLKGKIELKKYAKEECVTMLPQRQKLYELWHKA